jgi:hypothetical protein
MAGGDEDDVDSIALGALQPGAFQFPSALACPMIGSTALRRLSSRLTVAEAMPRG